MFLPYKIYLNNVLIFETVKKSKLYVELQQKFQKSVLKSPEPKKGV